MLSDKTADGPMAPIETQSAQYSLLMLALPGSDPVEMGVLLRDPVRDQLHIRLRRDWDRLAPPEDAEVLAGVEDDIARKGVEMGANKLLEGLELDLSNAIRISDRRETMVEDFQRALNRLYRQHVRSGVSEFRTHIPHYSLAAAGGPFLENREIDEQAPEWVEAPPGLRLTDDMFVAQVQGRSMEPMIPDQSMCIFRRNVTGSRDGRLVLVEALGRGANDRYTVKRYRSSKIQNQDGTWSHQTIRLEPLNPDFEAWELDPEENRYQVLAEFVQLLD